MTTEFLERPEGRIAYDISGTGPLIVCIPGMGELRSTFRHNVAPLVAAGFRVATMDLRGHGDSDTGFATYDDVAAGQDALALVEHLGGPALLVGNSMGAAAAAWAAAERPELVTGLALSGPLLRNPPVNPVLSLAMRVLTSGPWAGRMWLSYLPKLSPGTRAADWDAHRADIAASIGRPRYRAAFSRTTRTSHAPVERRVGEITCPVLVLMGERDPDFRDPAAEAEWLGSTLHARVELVPGIGHYPHADAADVVNPALVDFASAVARA